MPCHGVPVRQQLTVNPIETLSELSLSSGAQGLDLKVCAILFPKKDQQMASLEFSTCDFCDLHKADESGGFRVLPPVFRSFGGISKFSGKVATVKCFEDNTSVKNAVESPGEGRVLVVDGGSSLRRALVGGNLASAAHRNGWAGLVIDGCVRDQSELAAVQLGILALALMPLPTERRAEGLRDTAVRIQQVWVRPGDWLYADEDGIVVSQHPLHR